MFLRESTILPDQRFFFLHMIAPIFRSKLRQDILTLYFTHPDSAFFLRELARRFNCSVGSLQRELTCLSKEGILLHEKKANVKLFRLNKEYPLLTEMTGILQKTIGVTILVEDIVHAMSDVELAFIYGSYAKSPFYLLDTVEVMVISDNFDQAAFDEKADILEKGLRRRIRARAINADELRKAVGKGDREIKRILRNAKIFVKGDQDILDGIMNASALSEEIEKTQQNIHNMMQYSH